MPYMMVQLLFSLAGLPSDIVGEVPYKSDAETVLGILGGQVDFHCAGASALMPEVKAAKLRVLAIATPERWDELPDAPTAREGGFAGLEKIVGWSALHGPPGLPAPIVSKWTEVMTKLASDSGWIAGKCSFDGIPSARSPTETDRFALEQFTLYETLGKQIGTTK